MTFGKLFGVLLGLGFIAASAGANYEFASHLAPSAIGGIVYGVLSASVSGFVVRLPFIIAEAKRNGETSRANIGRLFWVLFFCWSLFSALGFAASTRGEVTKGRDDLTAKLATANKSLNEVESQLKDLPAYRASAVVEQAIAVIRQDRRWLSSKSCVDATAQASLDFCRSFFTAQGELQTAKQGEALAAKRDTLRASVADLRNGGAGLESDPQAALLSWVSGGRFDEPTSRKVLEIFMAVLVELGAAFSLYLTLGTHSGPPKSRVVMGEVLTPRPVDLPSPNVLRLPRRV